jgi:hypothetical protein
MIIAIEGHEKDAKVSENRYSDFVAITLYVEGRLVPLPDTFSRQYRVVEATSREREMLKCWGYKLEGL